jgi:hypothetical protein
VFFFFLGGEGGELSALYVCGAVAPLSANPTGRPSAAEALRSRRPTGDGGSGAQHIPFYCANDYCQAVRAGRAAGWSGLSSCVQPLAAPQCGYPPSSTRCACDHAACLAGLPVCGSH